MPHDAIFRDNGNGDRRNKYKAVFTGDHEPQKTTRRGATKDGNDTKYKNKKDQWVVQGYLNGGTDAWTYDGERVRMAFRYPERASVAVNDRDFYVSTAYGETDKMGGPEPEPEKHTLRIFSNNEAGYAFQTDGAILTANSAEGPDKITNNGTRAIGKVNGGEDTFTIHGPAKFKEFALKGSAQAELDDESVSAQDLSDTADPEPGLFDTLFASATSLFSGGDTGGDGPGVPAPSDVGHSGRVGWSPQTRTSGQHLRHGIEFDNIVHAVDDLGWEQDRPGDHVVNELPTDSDTLIEVPNGNWTVGENTLSHVSNWGVVGLGEKVNLRAPIGQTVRMVQASSRNTCNNLLVENVTLDQRGGRQAGIELRLTAEDRYHVENVRRIGQTPNRDTARGPYGKEPTGILANVLDPGGIGIIRNWTDHCHSRVIDYPDNGPSIFAGFDSRGITKVENASIKNQGEHAIYASKADNVRLDNCILLDNVNTNCRIAGPGSWARNCTIGYTRDVEYTREHDTGDLKATKGLRMEHSREHGVSGGTFTECKFVWETEGLSSDVLALIMGNVGGVVFDRCTFMNDTDAPTVQVDAEGTGWRGLDIPGDKTVTFNETLFSGSTDSPPVSNDRDGAVKLNNCEVE